MVTPQKMNDNSTFKGIRLEKIVESISFLKKQNIPSVLYTDFTTDKGGDMVDNSFGIQTSSQKGWYIIKKYEFFTNKIDEKSGFCVLLDNNNCLHIDENVIIT